MAFWDMARGFRLTPKQDEVDEYDAPAPAVDTSRGFQMSKPKDQYTAYIETQTTRPVLDDINDDGQRQTSRPSWSPGLPVPSSEPQSDPIPGFGTAYNYKPVSALPKEFESNDYERSAAGMLPTPSYMTPDEPAQPTPSLFSPTPSATPAAPAKPEPAAPPIAGIGTPIPVKKPDLLAMAGIDKQADANWKKWQQDNRDAEARRKEFTQRAFEEQSRKRREWDEADMRGKMAGNTMGQWQALEDKAALGDESAAKELDRLGGNASFRHQLTREVRRDNLELDTERMNAKASADAAQQALENARADREDRRKDVELAMKQQMHPLEIETRKQALAEAERAFNEAKATQDARINKTKAEAERAGVGIQLDKQQLEKAAQDFKIGEKTLEKSVVDIAKAGEELKQLQQKPGETAKKEYEEKRKWVGEKITTLLGSGEVNALNALKDKWEAETEKRIAEDDKGARRGRDWVSKQANAEFMNEHRQMRDAIQARVMTVAKLSGLPPEEVAQIAQLNLEKPVPLKSRRAAQTSWEEWKDFKNQILNDTGKAASVYGAVRGNMIAPMGVPGTAMPSQP